MADDKPQTPEELRAYSQRLYERTRAALALVQGAFGEDATPMLMLGVAAALAKFDGLSETDFLHGAEVAFRAIKVQRPTGRQN